MGGGMSDLISKSWQEAASKVHKHIRDDVESQAMIDRISNKDTKSMKQFYVRTKSYQWTWDVKDSDDGSMCKEVGLISVKGFQDRAKAIAAGEYTPQLTDPKCWFMPPNDNGE